MRYSIPLQIFQSLSAKKLLQFWERIIPFSAMLVEHEGISPTTDGKEVIPASESTKQHQISQFLLSTYPMLEYILASSMETTLQAKKYL